MILNMDLRNKQIIETQKLYPINLKIKWSL